MHKNRHLLLMHGLMGSIDYFSPAKYLTDINVHTPDLLGYGQHRALAAGQSINLHKQAEHIVAVIRDRIGQPTWLLGHSVGSAIAMLVAQRIPNLVRGLISVEENFTLNDAFWCARIAASAESTWHSD
jgi:pimeloyl-ACP methyl ester carboxylesterase